MSAPSWVHSPTLGLGHVGECIQQGSDIDGEASYNSGMVCGALALGAFSKMVMDTDIVLVILGVGILEMKPSLMHA